MAAEELITRGLLPLGATVFGPVPVLNRHNFVRVSIERHTWPRLRLTEGKIDLMRLEVDCFVRGVWLMIGGITADGGDVIRKDGTVSPASTMTTPLPEGQNRQIRGRVICLQPIDSRVWVELL